MSDSLGDALPRELQRNRQLLADYQSIGPAGNFGAAMIEANIRAAEQALASGDVIEMIRVYHELRDAQ
jgi:hypothetical protein